MIRIILAFIIGLSAHATAWAIDEAAVDEYNKMIDTVAERLIEIKPNYPELSEFSRRTVRKDGQDFKVITYFHNPADPSFQEDPYTFQFVIKAIPLEGQEPATPGQWRFPLLGFKVVADVMRSGNAVGVNLSSIIKNELDGLHALEQEYLPCRLRITTDKDSYKVDEPITITVSLRNEGKQSFQVADLNEGSLFCRIDGTTWGGESLQEEVPRTVLAPGETLSKILRVKGIEEPKDMRISCRYALGFQGAQPFTRLNVRIEPDS